MANQVFANGREVACKAGAGKTICATPDVCMTPPENPATPPGVPVPYPNTGLASDTTEGSKSVQISGEEVTLKNVSYFKKSSGDEAGCAAKKGVISSKNTGKVYFIGWSMNVKFEGQNAARHLDQTTNNHASPAANEALPWPFVDMMTKAEKKKCKKNKRDEKTACADYEPHKKPGKDVCKEAGLSGKFSKKAAVAGQRAKDASQNKCAAARRCRLMAFDAKPEDGINGCCPSQTGDHLVPKSSFFETSVKAKDLLSDWKPSATKTGYNIAKAPCMCTEGGSCSGSHGLRHAHHKAYGPVKPGKKHSFNDEVKHCAKGAHEIAPQCSKACIEAQLKAGHRKMGNTSGKVKHSPTGKNYTANKPGLMARIARLFVKGGPPAGP